MDPTRRIHDLIDITERLANLLMRENQALRDKRAQEAVQYLEEKNNLSRIYETRLKNFSEQPEAYRDVDVGLRTRLREMGEKVNAMISENARLLKVTIEANRRIVELVADAVKEQQSGPGIYSAKGAPKVNDLHSAPQNLALSVDRSL